MLIAILVILSYVRIFFLNQVFSDDRHFLQSIYTSSSIADFLKTSGLIELRRVPQGVILYSLLSLFKITDHAFLILHLVSIATQIITPIFLYLLINRLFQNKLAAFITAISLVIYPIDTTLAVFIILWYRFGLMLSIISFYLSLRAIEGKTRWFYFTGALFLSAISYYFLVETTIALEPARLFMFGLIMYNKGLKTKEIIFKSFRFWLPFLFICIPIVLMKLIFKPYGIHSGFYTAHLSSLLNWKLHLKYLIMLFGGNWVYSLQKVKYLSVLTVILALSVLPLVYFFLKSKYFDKTGVMEINNFSQPFFKLRLLRLMRIDMIIMFGLILLVPVFLIYEIFANTPLGTEYDSRHGCIMQFGNAIIIGGIICGIISKLIGSRNNSQKIAFILAGALGLGVFFNNLNLDRYFALWVQEKQFYGAFIQRFPALPANSTFAFDIQTEIPLKDHPYAFYNVEYYLNLLYGKSKVPEDFREYKVPSLEWFFVDRFKIDNNRCSMLTYWGRDIYDGRKLTVVRWKPGEFLVNREILNRYPQVYYKNFADKEPPVIPPVQDYPLRNKVERFLVR